MERVNRIAFVDTSNFNGSKAFVLISSNFCSISSNRSLSGDVSFRSVGEKRNELPDFFPKAHVMEQVYRSAFLNTGVFNGFRASVQLFSNYYRIPPTRFAKLPVDSNCLHACLKVIHQCTLQRKRPPIRMSKVSHFSTIIYDCI